VPHFFPAKVEFKWLKTIMVHYQIIKLQQVCSSVHLVLGCSFLVVRKIAVMINIV
jgi:hypothetical protein